MRFLRTTQNPLLRNVASLVGATAIAQAVQLGVTPFLTRIYGPEEFAVFQVFYSASAVLSVIATLRYEMAIVATDKHDESKHLLSGSLGISLIFGSVVFLTLVLMDIYPTIHIPATYLFFIPVYVIFAGASQSFDNFSIRNSHYRLNFWSRILSSLFQAGTAFAFGLAGALQTGLMASVVAGQITSTAVLANSFPFKDRNEAFPSPFRKILESFKRHKKFPLYNAPHALINVLQDHGIIFIFGLFFESTLIAFYGQAYRLLKAPVGFLGTAIHQVYYPDFTKRLQSGQNLRPSLIRIYVRLFLIGLPFFTLIAFEAVPIFTWLLGSEWSEVGRIAQALTPWLFLNFIVSPLDSIPLILSRQGTAALVALLEFIARSTVVAIAGLYNDSQIALILIGILGASFALFKLGWYYWLGGLVKRQ